jgi:ABC-type Fe3+-hydroxamate transport system substrate-binding protein
MPSYADQTGRTITLHHPPRSIVSLVPSQTELLYDLGLDKTVTGITKFCIHPHSWFRKKIKIGGTKLLKTATIRALQPDLIIANKEENVKEQVDELSMDYPVWISDVHNLQTATEMIETIGEITGNGKKAKTINTEILNNFSQLRPAAKPVKTAYLIWLNPYMTIGGDTFINDMLNRCGFNNIFENRQRYPLITIEELQAACCELLLLSSEPFPFKEKHIAELQPQLPSTKIVLADGEMFSWYGSRLLQAPAYFSSLIQSLRVVSSK